MYALLLIAIMYVLFIYLFRKLHNRPARE